MNVCMDKVQCPTCGAHLEVIIIGDHDDTKHRKEVQHGGHTPQSGHELPTVR